MIPATFPSVLDSSNRTKMLVYQVPSITGLTRWVDYIPVKSPASESDLTLANTYANEGFILTSKVNDITGLVPFKDYVPIYLDSTATKAWSADNDGYIPMSELAGLLLDFTTGSLDARINFSRTTNATVTNSAGVITYAPHNLITFSEQFDNAAWTKSLTTVIANSITSPNGTITADKLVATATTGEHSVFQTFDLSGRTITYSCVMKAGEYQYGFLRAKQGGTYTNVIFNLNTGTIHSGALPAEIENLGDGWYRCSATFQPNSIASWVVGVSSDGASESSTGNGTSGIYIWGAQLEIGSTATTYNSTTVKNLLGYSELFDNAAWTKSNSFVQTNLINYSEAFDNANWQKYGTTVVTADTTIAPNGYQTADTLTGATDITYAGNNLYRGATSLSSSTAYTFSIYIKGLVGTTAKIAIRDNTLGTITDSGAITLTSDWQRVSLTRTTGAATTSLGLIVGATNGTVAIWGAQLVQGSTAGDYRRTDAAALPVYYPNHNGVVCAEKLVENTVNSTHNFVQAVNLTNGTPVTFSIYAKAGERNVIWMRSTGTGNISGAYFDLSAGTVTSVTSGSAAIQSIGNGWYRCSVKGNSDITGSGNQLIYLVQSGTTFNYTGDGTSGIYIFGAQVSDSASLDPYVLNAAAAPTAAAYYGARFDYDPVTLAPKGLLIEEQRTNLLTYSDDYTNAIWTKVGATVSGNVISLPTEGDRIFQAKTVVSGTVYTASVYLSGSGTVLMGFGTNTNTFKTVTLTSTPTRHEVVHTAGSTSGVFFAAYRSGTTATSVTVSYPQLEAGAFATSYIPTAASQVTRAADVATIQGSNFYGFYNQNEGSFYVNQIVGTAKASGNASVHVDDGASNANSMWFGQLVSPDSVRTQLTLINSSTQSLIQSTLPLDTGLTVKSAGGYKVNDFAGVLNNGTVGTDTSGNPPNIQRMFIGNIASGTQNLNGHIKQISYYPQRLSDSVLKGLTA